MNKTNNLFREKKNPKKFSLKFFEKEINNNINSNEKYHVKVQSHEMLSLYSGTHPFCIVMKFSLCCWCADSVIVAAGFSYGGFHRKIKCETKKA